MHWGHVFEFLKEVGVFAALHAFVERFGAKGGEKALNKVVEEHRGEMLGFISADPDLDEKARRNLWRRWEARQLRKEKSYGPKKPRDSKNPASPLERERYNYGDEVKFAGNLTKVFMGLSQLREAERRIELAKKLKELDPSRRLDTEFLLASDEKKRLIETFNHLGHLSDSQFDAAILMMDNDAVNQWLRKIGTGVNQIGAWASDTFGEHWPAVKQAFVEHEQAAARELGKLADYLEGLPGGKPRGGSASSPNATNPSVMERVRRRFFHEDEPVPDWLEEMRRVK